MLKVLRAKPNPLGKDRTVNSATPEQQLAGEWIDIQNVHSTALNLTGLQIYHIAYTAAGNEWELVSEFSSRNNFNTNFTLPVGAILRVHSGGKLEESQLLPQDRTGADHHWFTCTNYVWNNYRQDTPMIWNPTRKERIDETYYDSPVPDGKILQRLQNKLV